MLLSSSIIDLFMIFLNALKDLILRVLESTLFHIFGHRKAKEYRPSVVDLRGR